MLLPALPNKLSALFPEKFNQHNYDANEEHEKRNSVHAMHHGYINVFRVVRVSFTDVQVGEYLVPDALFHSKSYFYKVMQNFSKRLYLQPTRGISSAG